MPNSMTGFGRAERRHGELVITAEARSVNNRYLNVRMRIPPRFARLESKLEAEVKRRVSRGSVDVTVRAKGRAAGDKAVLDEELARSWLASIRGLADRAGLADDVRVDSLLALPGVVVTEEDDDLPEPEARVVTGAVKEAIAELCAMRSAEGARMAEELTRLVGRVDKLTDTIESRARKAPAKMKARYKERIEALLGSDKELDPGALEREVAILADKSDITEEVARLKSHAEEFRSTLAKKGPVGRPLDFLVQELAREANTVASKNQDVEIGRKVIDLRSHIDRLREQVQNLE